MRIALFISLLLFFSQNLFAQDIDGDSLLSEVVVEAYNAARPTAQVAASVASLDRKLFDSFEPTSLVTAVNTVPGVRMEERSPGSYRFAIRGSSIRSPFGVRNVKMYLNGLPFTDAGGNTYLNLIDPLILGNAEIIKGPGGSLYGAGTGGVVLMNTRETGENYLDFLVQRGSYNAEKYAASLGTSNQNLTSLTNYIHSGSDGYRDQSAIRRDAFNTTLNFRINSDHALSANVLYTDLFYETPGGLTEAQYNDDPSQARPAAGPNPGAEEQQAAIYNQTAYFGLTHEGSWNDLETTTSIYSSLVDFKNPSIREYEVRDERNLGLRSVGKYSTQHSSYELILIGGLEFQYLDSPVRKYENLSGHKGAQLSDDDLTSTSSMVFAQSEFLLKHWIFTAGLSVNWFNIGYSNADEDISRDFDPALSPRLTVLRKFSDYSLYAGFSRGFSSPTIADLYPSGGKFSKTLQAEFGNNFEIGLKGNPARRLYYELTAYDFRLSNTIVRREEDAEYFVNAGETLQRGVEASLTWKVFESTTGVLSRFSITSSYAYNHYTFSDYVKVTDDISGNELTGVPPTTLYGSVNAVFHNRLALTISFNYVDHIPLNDENTSFANPYNLMAARVGYKIPLRSYDIEIYAGGDNLLDETYSLGNDLNALAGRYYNAAPLMNFYGGVKLHVFE